MVVANYIKYKWIIQVVSINQGKLYGIYLDIKIKDVM